MTNERGTAILRGLLAQVDFLPDTDREEIEKALVTDENQKRIGGIFVDGPTEGVERLVAETWFELDPNGRGELRSAFSELAKPGAEISVRGLRRVLHRTTLGVRYGGQRDRIAPGTRVGDFRVQGRLVRPGRIVEEVYEARGRTGRVLLRFVSTEHEDRGKVLATCRELVASPRRPGRQSVLAVLDLPEGIFLVLEDRDAYWISTYAPLDEPQVVECGRQLARAIGPGLRIDWEPRLIRSGSAGLLAPVILPFHEPVGIRHGPVDSSAWIPFNAPERLDNVLSIDERSDVYGAGALIFFLLSGKPPFKGPSNLAVFKDVLGTPPPLGELRASEGLKNIIDRAMRKKPEERLLTEELVAALDELR